MMMSRWRATVRDGRGDKVTVYSGESRAEVPDVVFDRIRRRLDPGTPVRALRAVDLITGTAGVLCGIAFVWITRGNGLLGSLAVVGLILSLASAGLSLKRRLPPAAPGRLAKAMLEEGLCASCAYPAGASPAAPDGCIVCPECGAAWRVRRHGC